MADRRMFAKSIVLSDVFTDMPMSARCLYFTLGMFADDDGFVGSPKSIMRQCGASEDDMKVLIAKKFILRFESGVIVIKHWRMNNYLRADRHHPTTYLEEYNTLGIDDKGAYTQNIDKMKQLPSGIPSDNQVTTKCQPSDNQVVDGWYTEVSIGKDSINNKSISKDILRPTKNVERVISEWNNLPEPIKKVRGLTPTTERYKMLTSRIKEYGIDAVIEAIHKVGESDFLRKGSDKGWEIDFGWFVRPNNFPKVLEGKYDNKGSVQKPKSEWDLHMWSEALKNGSVTEDEYKEWKLNHAI